MDNRLKELRLKCNLTQQQLAVHLRVSRQTIIAIEKGKYDPSLQLAMGIARFFDTCIEDIFDDRESSCARRPSTP